MGSNMSYIDNTSTLHFGTDSDGALTTDAEVGYSIDTQIQDSPTVSIHIENQPLKLKSIDIDRSLPYLRKEGSTLPTYLGWELRGPK